MAVQDKFNKPNVIYKITKDIDLKGGTLTIPEGCTLDFQGGSFSNGTIIGNSTKIISTINRIFSTNITIDGTWDIPYAYAEWFGAKGDGIADDTLPIQKSIDIFDRLDLSNNKVYTITYPILINNPVIIQGNNSTIIKTTSNTASIGDMECITGGKVNCDKDAVILSYGSFLFSKIEDLRLKGYDNKSVGIFLLNSQKSNIKGVYIYNCEIGVQVKNAFMTTLDNIVVENSKYGFFFDNSRNIGVGGTGTTVTFNNCYSIGGANTDSGFNLKSLYYSTLVNCASEGAKNAYNFIDVNANMLSCGAEQSKGPLLIANACKLNLENIAYDCIYDFPTCIITNSYITINKGFLTKVTKYLVNIEANSKVLIKDCVIGGEYQFYFVDDSSSVIIVEDNGNKDIYWKSNSTKVNLRKEGTNRRVYKGKVNTKYLKITIYPYSGSLADLGSLAGGTQIGLYAESDGAGIATRGTQFYCNFLNSGWGVKNSYIALTSPKGTRYFNSFHVEKSSEGEVYIYIEANTVGDIYYDILGAYDNIKIESIPSMPSSYIRIEEGGIYMDDVWVNYKKTASSTTRPAISAGQSFFDSTLNKPVWWSGTDWVDATGTIV